MNNRKQHDRPPSVQPIGHTEEMESSQQENRLLVSKASTEQWLIFLLAVVGLIASFLLQVKPDDSQSVYIRFTDIRLPGTCISRTVLNHDCPGCGLTRSIVCLSQGELGRSLRFNLTGVFLYVFAIGYIGFFLTRQKIPVHHFVHSQNAWPTFAWTCISLALIHWGIKLVY